MAEYDGIVVGSGPNGLAAAIELARSGWKVLLIEGSDQLGGGMRSAELTLPGFTHDICSAIHPLGMGSPFFKTLPLTQYGLEWIQPEYPLGHPLDDGSAALMCRSIEDTGKSLGVDAKAYKRLMEPLVNNWDKLADDILGPFPFPPKHPLAISLFGLNAIRPAHELAQHWFKGPHARALFAGIAAHSFLPLNQVLTASFGLVLGLLGHAMGWPLPRGGSQKIADSMVAYFKSLGGEIVTGQWVNSLDELPPSRAVLFDVTPRQLLRIVGDKFPVGYRRALERYRYGPGVFKVDWALSGPIPWKNPELAKAGTVHVGGTIEEIAVGEGAAYYGKIEDKPMVLVAQQSLFDSTRAPKGQHTGWGYCHVPNGSTIDMTERIEKQIERFAPGFRDLIIARSTRNTQQVNEHNPNYIGGDINGGVQDMFQLFTRPTLRLFNPYSTPLKNVFICSSSTPPGGGVHGMCGYHAAHAAMKAVGK